MLNARRVAIAEAGHQTVEQEDRWPETAGFPLRFGLQDDRLRDQRLGVGVVERAFDTALQRRRILRFRTEAIKDPIQHERVIEGHHEENEILDDGCLVPLASQLVVDAVEPLRGGVLPPSVRCRWVPLSPHPRLTSRPSIVDTSPRTSIRARDRDLPCASTVCQRSSTATDTRAVQLLGRTS